jgi:hypothetical protein
VEKINRFFAGRVGQLRGAEEDLLGIHCVETDRHQAGFGERVD